MHLNIQPASTGARWVKEGIRTFLRQPLAMGGLFLMYMAAVSLLTVVPVVGNAMALALLPAATLGLMAATRMAGEGKFPMPKVLATAFAAGKERARAMLALGALYTLAFSALLGLSALVDGGLFAKVYLGTLRLTQETATLPSFQQAFWLTMTLYLPLTALFWHAPALVHWHDVPPVKSLFFSAVACWRNKGAMLVYGLSWLGIFMFGGLAVSVIVSASGDSEVASSLASPVILMLAAMFFTSIWFTFRDSFVSDAPPDAATDTQSDL